MNHPFNFKHTFSQKQINDLCEARNRIVHYGFSPQDDDTSIRLLLKTGFNLLKHCYKVFFDFYLDWRDVKPGTNSFHDLAPDEMAKVGLVPHFSDAMNVAHIIYNKSKSSQNIDLTYCIFPLLYVIRYASKGNFIGPAEESLIVDDGNYRVYEAVSESKKLLEKNFMSSCAASCFELNCPVCDGFESVIAQIDDTKLEKLEVSFKRAACVMCGLYLTDKPFIASTFLKEEIDARRDDILKNFGLK